MSEQIIRINRDPDRSSDPLAADVSSPYGITTPLMGPEDLFPPKVPSEPQMRELDGSYRSDITHTCAKERTETRRPKELMIV